MFYGASNVQLGGELLKFYYPKLTVMRGSEDNASTFFNNISKMPILNQMIISHERVRSYYCKDE